MWQLCFKGLSAPTELGLVFQSTVTPATGVYCINAMIWQSRERAWHLYPGLLVRVVIKS